MSMPPKSLGRPRGARNRLATRLLEDLLTDWQEHGEAAIRLMRMEDPSGYCRLMVSTLPKEFTIETAMSDLDDEQLDDLIVQVRQHLLEQQRPEPILIEAKPEKVKND
jgi:hypothetical protein